MYLNALLLCLCGTYAVVRERGHCGSMSQKGFSWCLNFFHLFFKGF